MATTPNPERLVAVGLSRYEACAYLSLLGHDDSTAVEAADRAGVPRQRIYDVFLSLHDKGLINIRDGRPARYSARPPSVALPAMFEARLRAQQQENDRIASLIQQLVPALEPDGNGGGNGNGASRAPANAARSGEEVIGGF